MLLAFGGSAMAQTPGIDLGGTVGYVIDARGFVAKSGTGLCWRTGYWTPAMAIAECDPDLVPKPAPAPAPAPVVVPPPPPPPPVVKPAPPPPPPPKKCDFSLALSSDQTFKFNKADLAPAAKARIDGEFMSKFGACASVTSVEVIGHTDRLGTDKYNDALSARRADAVAKYLSAKGVKDVKAVGVGKSQPLADVSCSDKLPRKKLIDCLAPNRRVVIQVQGMAK